MQEICEFSSYKDIVNSLVVSGANKGRGQYRKLAIYLGVSSVLVSQVFKGDRDFDRDKAFLTSEFFGLDGLQRDYFMAVFEENKAQNKVYKQFAGQKVAEIRERLQSMSEKYSENESIDDAERNFYYSSWIYPCIRLALMNKEVNTTIDISEFLGISLREVTKAVEFLLQARLIQQTPAGYQVSQKHIHLDRESPLITKHHLNLKDLELRKILSGVSKEELCFSSLSIVSRKVFNDKIEVIKNLLADINEDFVESESEDLIMVNLSMLKVSSYDEFLQNKKSVSSPAPKAGDSIHAHGRSERSPEPLVNLC